MVDPDVRSSKYQLLGFSDASSDDADKVLQFAPIPSEDENETRRKKKLKRFVVTKTIWK